MMAAGGSPSCYSRLETLIAKVIFLATGVWWGVGVQLMVYAGIAAEPSALLPNFTWYAPQRRVMLCSRNSRRDTGKRCEPW